MAKHKLNEQWVEEFDVKKHMLKVVEQAKTINADVCGGCYFGVCGDICHDGAYTYVDMVKVNAHSIMLIGLSKTLASSTMTDCSHVRSVESIPQPRLKVWRTAILVDMILTWMTGTGGSDDY